MDLYITKWSLPPQKAMLESEDASEAEEEAAPSRKLEEVAETAKRQIDEERREFLSTRDEIEDALLQKKKMKLDKRVSRKHSE